MSRYVGVSSSLAFHSQTPRAPQHWGHHSPLSTEDGNMKEELVAPGDRKNLFIIILNSYEMLVSCVRDPSLPEVHCQTHCPRSLQQES